MWRLDVSAEAELEIQAHARPLTIRVIIHSDDMTSDRTRRVTVRRYESAAEADRHDIEYCMQLSDAERVLQVWRLSLELAQLRGDPPYEPGRYRSVVRIHRAE